MGRYLEILTKGPITETRNRDHENTKFTNITKEHFSGGWEEFFVLLVMFEFSRKRGFVFSGCL